jgi:uncharacterized protein YlxP (DUF503 family)
MKLKFCVSVYSFSIQDLYDRDRDAVAAFSSATAAVCHAFEKLMNTISGLNACYNEESTAR